MTVLREVDEMTRFGAVLQRALADGTRVRFRAAGVSMHPTIRDGEVITIAPIRAGEVSRGDVLLCRHQKRMLAHRVVGLTARGDERLFLLQGDAKAGCDAPVAARDVVGKVVSVCRNGREIPLCDRLARLRYAIRKSASRAKALVRR